MSQPRRGEIWWAETPEEKRRPYVVLTRDAAIPVMRKLLVAPVTRRVRRIPTEVPLGPAEGLPEPCAASMDNVQVFLKALLTARAGAIGSERSHELCRALNAAVDC
ncbi:MAG: type II toxin-antitoxin system PemK/MazF family toxin [Actinomycetota bacterium]